MKELIRVRVQYGSRQQCCKSHKRPLPLPFTLRNKNIVKEESSEIAECGCYKVLNGEKYQAGSEESYGCLEAMQEVFAHARMEN